MIILSLNRPCVFGVFQGFRVYEADAGGVFIECLPVLSMCYHPHKESVPRRSPWSDGDQDSSLYQDAILRSPWRCEEASGGSFYIVQCAIALHNTISTLPKPRRLTTPPPDRSKPLSVDVQVFRVFCHPDIFLACALPRRQTETPSGLYELPPPSRQ